VTIIDRGRGDPIIVIPGIQGRWPYVEATVQALARTYRVLTYSLAGEPDGRRFDPARGFENYVDDLAAVLGAAGVPAAALVGISFGGIVALRFAATQPARTRALILVSTPGPDWTPNPRQQRYLRAPGRGGVRFLIESPSRVAPELRTALPSLRDRGRFSLAQLRALARAPLSFARMAERAALAVAADRRGDAVRVTAATLVVAGEERLDRVVPAAGTLQYEHIVQGARAVVMANTGHLGSLTHADRFAGIVNGFLNGLRNAAA
jgi:pimeloyl-ACP methyl ester carboxylesterase